MINVIGCFLLGSLLLNAYLFVAYLRAQAYGKTQRSMFAHLRYRLQTLTCQWDMRDFCHYCKGEVSKHYLDCPRLTIPFAITKAEEIGKGK